MRLIAVEEHFLTREVRAAWAVAPGPVDALRGLAAAKRIERDMLRFRTVCKFVRAEDTRCHVMVIERVRS
jgi:hypothetical protein